VLIRGKIRLELALERVIRAAEKHERKLLEHIGGYIRKTAMRSMKKGMGRTVSRPGRPPFTWTKVYPASQRYAYDKETRTVVVGGLRYGKHPGRIPKIIEYGGTEVLLSLRTGRIGIGSYLPRPALRLALLKAIDQAIGAAIRGFVKP